MATVQDLKRRIRSIRNTRKITKAMELVASARLRRAQARIEAMRPYADRMTELMMGTAKASTSLQGLALLQRREVKKAAIIPLTGDRGLAGAFNAQVLRHAFALERQLRGDGVEVHWLVAGKKGRSTLGFRRYEIDQSWIGFSDRPSYHDAQAIAREGGRALRDRRGRPRRDRLQPVRLGARSAGGRARPAADPGGGARAHDEAEHERRCSATSSTSPSPRRSCSACCRSTSRRSSTARCSSRPPPSRARG